MRLLLAYHHHIDCQEWVGLMLDGMHRHINTYIHINIKEALNRWTSWRSFISVLTGTHMANTCIVCKAVKLKKILISVVMSCSVSSISITFLCLLVIFQKIDVFSAAMVWYKCNDCRCLNCGQKQKIYWFKTVFFPQPLFLKNHLICHCDTAVTALSCLQYSTSYYIQLRDVSGTHYYYGLYD